MRHTAKTVHIINPLSGFPSQLRGGVVAIGNFDGVHQGHRHLVEEAVGQARSSNQPALAMTFEPHPRTVFQPSNPVFRLTPSTEKAALLTACGIDAVLQTEFDLEFSRVTAEDFVARILVETLGVAHVVIGYDFHFGSKRAGSPDFLHEAGERYGFQVTVIDAHGDETGTAYSSSSIRNYLKEGDIPSANEVLGYVWFVTGDIRHGEKLGRTLGYPTANMALDPACGLRHGIYAVHMALDGMLLPGVASFGRRPTFDNGMPLLETHLFDFDRSIYGRTVSVQFHAFQRGEAKFDTAQALIAQMDEDSTLARMLLADLPAEADFAREVTQRLLSPIG